MDINKQPLTAKQASVLGYIKHFRDVSGMMPTYNDIKIGMGFKSANAAREHCRLIARKGHIRIIPRISRGITIV